MLDQSGGAGSASCPAAAPAALTLINYRRRPILTTRCPDGMALERLLPLLTIWQGGLASGYANPPIVERKVAKTAPAAIPGDGGWLVTQRTLVQLGEEARAASKRRAPLSL